MSDLEQQVKTLEARVKILKETLETLKNMSISGQMENCIKQNLKIVLSSTLHQRRHPLISTRKKNTIAHLSYAKQTIDDPIRAAIKDTGAFSDVAPGDSRCFSYEIEYGELV